MTYVNNLETFQADVKKTETFEGRLMNYFRSLGAIVEAGRLIEKPRQESSSDRLFVVVSVFNVLKP